VAAWTWKHYLLFVILTVLASGFIYIVERNGRKFDSRLFDLPDQINQEVIAFKNVRLPATEQDIKQQFPEVKCRDLPIAPLADAPIVRNCFADTSIAGANARVTFIFGMGRASCEEIRVTLLEQREFESVLASLTQKYGKPDTQTVPSQTPLYVWTTKNGLREIMAAGSTVIYRYHRSDDKTDATQNVKDL
jgi:hypothetical protein